MSTIDTTKVELSIVIPAYNEEERLPATLERLSRFVATQPRCVEILVVDDGSTDKTVSVCEELAQKTRGLRTIRTSPNRGKGHAVRVGVLAARGEVIVMFDADGSTPASELPKLLAPILRGEAPISIGSRYAEGAEVPARAWWRQGWSRLCNFFIQKTLVPGVLDTQCGFKAFTKEVAQHLFGQATVDGWAFDLEILALAKKLGYSVIEVPVKWVDDERSRVQPWRDLGQVVKEAISIKKSLSRVGPFSTTLQP